MTEPVPVRSGIHTVDAATRIHYRIAGSGRPLVLLHGFPQTGREWDRVLPALAQQWTVLVPDYRGAGDSTKPLDGYDKATMAEDIRDLVRAEVGDGPVSIVGHDLGSMVGFAWALRHRDQVERLVIIDAPMPGTDVWDRLTADPRAFHVNFHASVDIASALIAGREDWYVEQFIRARAVDFSLLERDVFHYARSYGAPGAMRAAFSAYRAMQEVDRVDNRALLAAEGRLDIPVLVVGGSASMSGPMLRAMADEVAADVRDVTVPNAGHWIPEEKPEELVVHLDEFLRPR